MKRSKEHLQDLVCYCSPIAAVAVVVVRAAVSAVPLAAFEPAAVAGTAVETAVVVAVVSGRHATAAGL